MGMESGISWTRSTFNPWIGCTKVGPGCDGCYAEATDNFHKYGGLGQTHWGDDKPRHRTSRGNWQGPLRWNALCALERQRGEIAPQNRGTGQKATWSRPGFWPVFCASLADVFDNKVDDQWRRDLWALIESTPNLSWLLVTKRIGNARKMVPARWITDGFPDHVRLLATIVNQAEADRDLPKLLELPCRNGVSYEPAIGPVDWKPWLARQCDNGSVPVVGGGSPCPRCLGSSVGGCPGLEWIIIGGESRQPGHDPREFRLEWAYTTIEQCLSARASPFVKQLGAKPTLAGNPVDQWDKAAGKDPQAWPGALQIQEFPA